MSKKSTKVGASMLITGLVMTFVLPLVVIILVGIVILAMDEKEAKKILELVDRK